MWIDYPRASWPVTSSEWAGVALGGFTELPGAGGGAEPRGGGGRGPASQHSEGSDPGQRVCTAWHELEAGSESKEVLLAWSIRLKVRKPLS